MARTLHFEKSSNMPKKLAKMKTSLVQLTLTPFLHSITSKTQNPGFEYPIRHYVLNTFCTFKAVVVHCRMGWGRTGMVLAMYLMAFYKKSAKLAIKEVRNLR